MYQQAYPKGAQQIITVKNLIFIEKISMLGYQLSTKI